MAAASHMPTAASGRRAHAMQIADGFDWTAVLSFNSFERNPKLDSDLFRFLTTKGAHMLEDR
jgi:hypothetical protein